MLIVEGKQGKSRVLEDLIKVIKKYHNIDSVALIDSVGVVGLHDLCTTYSLNDTDIDKLYDSFIENIETFKPYKTIIFEVNTTKDKLDKFKQIENEFNKDFIITVQNNDIDKVITYTF